MTQALVNNLNTIAKSNEMTFGEIPACGINAGFDKVYNEKVRTTSSLETLKKVAGNTLDELKNVLKEVKEELINEDSLDLTLARDVQEIIENINQDLAEDITNINDVESQIGEELMETPAITMAAETLLAQNSYQEANFSLDSFEMTETISNEAEAEISKPQEEVEEKTLKDLVDEDILEELNVELVESETMDFGNSSGYDFMQQSAEEQGIKAMFAPDGSKSSQEIFNPETNVADTANKANPSKILDQISKQMEGLQNGSKVNIVLNPESLGKVSLQIINTKEGLSAQFTVSSQEARDVIMKGLDSLKNSLSAQGVNVDNLIVKMNETQSAEYNADWTDRESFGGRNKEQKNSKENREEQKQFEKMMETAQEDDKNGNV